jgi:hypothetical protein
MDLNGQLLRGKPKSTSRDCGAADDDDDDDDDGSLDRHRHFYNERAVPT